MGTEIFVLVLQGEAESHEPAPSVHGSNSCFVSTLCTFSCKGWCQDHLVYLLFNSALAYFVNPANFLVTKIYKCQLLTLQVFLTSPLDCFFPICCYTVAIIFFFFSAYFSVQALKSQCSSTENYFFLTERTSTVVIPYAGSEFCLLVK